MKGRVVVVEMGQAQSVLFSLAAVVAAVVLMWVVVELANEMLARRLERQWRDEDGD